MELKGPAIFFLNSSEIREWWRNAPLVCSSVALSVTSVIVNLLETVSGGMGFRLQNPREAQLTLNVSQSFQWKPPALCQRPRLDFGSGNFHQKKYHFPLISEKKHWVMWLFCFGLMKMTAYEGNPDLLLLLPCFLLQFVRTNVFYVCV